MRTNDLFLTAAAASMIMLAACTHDDGTTSISEPTPVGNELIISTRHSEMGITRAESNIQESQFDNDEEIHIFLKDAYTGGVEGTTTYEYPLIYKKTETESVTGRNIKTYVGSTTNENRLFWPKLMHSLDIFGVYPKNSVTTDVKVGATYSPFDKNEFYYFTVAEDQTEPLNYKNSDLMTGLPTNYNDVHAGSYDANDPAANDAPFKLKQNENPGTIPLTFTHRLTKIIINITKTTGTKDFDIRLEDLEYTGTNDKKYARVTLLNTLRKTKFKVNSNDAVDKDHIITVSPDQVIVGKGGTTTTTNTNGYTAVTLAAIVPPQKIDKNKVFIKVDLIDEDRTDIDADNANNRIYDTFLYKIPSTGDLILAPSTVYTYTIRINKPHIDVSTTISPWTSGPINHVVGVLQ